MAIHFICAALAASTLFKESSNAKQLRGNTPSFSALIILSVEEEVQAILHGVELLVETRYSQDFL